MKLVYILLALVFVKVILLYKLYNSVPAVELKRLARAKNKRAEALYKVANYEAALDVLLWILGVASGAALFIWSARFSVYLAVGVIVVTAWLTIWAPAPRWNGWFGSLAAMLAKYQAAVLSFLNPVLGRIASWFPPAYRVHFHTGLYEKKDLVELLSRQSGQLDNRIHPADLTIAQGTVTFGDKLVRSIMTPRRQIKMVEAEETVGPMLMDDLHKTGHSRFPVIKEAATKGTSPEVVGTLYLKDIVGYSGSAKVKSLARKDVYYINEDSSLRQALDAFLKSHHHLLIVVNSFEEIVGVLSLEDVLEQIVGSPILDEFDQYENLRAVAAMDAKKDRTGHHEIKPENPPPDTEVQTD
jgi:CBS domain containing-hemolysin-like protein